MHTKGNLIFDRSQQPGQGHHYILKFVPARQGQVVRCKRIIGGWKELVSVISKIVCPAPQWVMDNENKLHGEIVDVEVNTNDLSNAGM